MRRRAAGKALQHENLSHRRGQRTAVREPGPGFAGLLLSSALFLPNLSAKHDPLPSSWTADSKERSEFSGFYFNGLSYPRERKEAQSRAAPLCLVNPTPARPCSPGTQGPACNKKGLWWRGERRGRKPACLLTTSTSCCSKQQPRVAVQNSYRLPRRTDWDHQTSPLADLLLSEEPSDPRGHPVSAVHQHQMPDSRPGRLPRARAWSHSTPSSDPHCPRKLPSPSYQIPLLFKSSPCGLVLPWGGF